MTRRTAFKEWLAGHRLVSGFASLLLIAALFREQYQFTIVVGESMLPTLRPGELLLVDRRAYSRQTPHRGDIVMARYGQDLILKRIVGLPGEEIEVKQGSLYVNGEPENESYAVLTGHLEVGKGRLFDDDFATLGDNRDIPSAVAVHPVLTRGDILGRVIMRFGQLWPEAHTGRP